MSYEKTVRRVDPRNTESWCREGVAHDHGACGSLWDSSDPRDLEEAARWASALAMPADPSPNFDRVAQAHDPDGVPLWQHLCGYVEAFRNVPLDEPPYGGGCDKCDSGYPQTGDWRPLLVEASHRPPGPVKVRPVVLRLPEVTSEILDGQLVGRAGDRYVWDGVWESIGPRPGWRGCLGHVLEREGGSVEVELSNPPTT